MSPARQLGWVLVELGWLPGHELEPRLRALPASADLCDMLLSEGRLDRQQVDFARGRARAALEASGSSPGLVPPPSDSGSGEWMSSPTIALAPGDVQRAMEESRGPSESADFSGMANDPTRAASPPSGAPEPGAGGMAAFLATPMAGQEPTPSAERLAETVRRSGPAGGAAAFLNSPMPGAGGAAAFLASPLPGPAGARGPQAPGSPGPPSTVEGSRVVEGDADRIGDYELLSELSRGGMGVVYRAQHTRLGGVVALKTLIDQDGAVEQLRRFQIEAEATARLEHPNIVRVLDFGRASDGRSFLVMDFVEGRDLKSVVRGDGPLPVEEAVAVVATVARALDHAHERGVLHRDIKPANILRRSSDGRILVTDFGLARDSSRKAELEGLTVTGQILGTPQYMPPEQVDADPRQIDLRADVYSLGALLFELVTGRPPFRNDSLPALLMEVFEQPAPLLRSLDPSLPVDLETVCARCLEKRKQDRYPTAAALADDLDRIARGESIVAQPLGLTERAGRWLKARERGLRVAAGVALAATIGLLATFGLRAWQRGLERERVRRRAEADAAGLRVLGEARRRRAERLRELADEALAGVTASGADGTPRLEAVTKQLDDLESAQREVLERWRKTRLGLLPEGDSVGPEPRTIELELRAEERRAVESRLWLGRSRAATADGRIKEARRLRERAFIAESTGPAGLEAALACAREVLKAGNARAARGLYEHLARYSEEAALVAEAREGRLTAALAAGDGLGRLEGSSVTELSDSGRSGVPELLAAGGLPADGPAVRIARVLSRLRGRSVEIPDGAATGWVLRGPDDGVWLLAPRDEGPTPVFRLVTEAGGEAAFRREGFLDLPGRLLRVMSPPVGAVPELRDTRALIVESSRSSGTNRRTGRVLCWVRFEPGGLSLDRLCPRTPLSAGATPLTFGDIAGDGRMALLLRVVEEDGRGRRQGWRLQPRDGSESRPVGADVAVEDCRVEAPRPLGTFLDRDRDGRADGVVVTRQSPTDSGLRVLELGADGGAGRVTDLPTGEVVALAVVPAHEPRLLVLTARGGRRSGRDRRNPRGARPATNGPAGLWQLSLGAGGPTLKRIGPAPALESVDDRAWIGWLPVGVGAAPLVCVGSSAESEPTGIVRLASLDDLTADGDASRAWLEVRALPALTPGKEGASSLWPDSSGRSEESSAEPLRLRLRAGGGELWRLAAAVPDEVARTADVPRLAADRLRAIRLLFHAGFFQGGLEVLEEILADRQTPVARRRVAFELKARALEACGRPGEAEAALRRLALEQPTLAIPMARETARLAMAAGHPKRAISDLEQIIREPKVSDTELEEPLEELLALRRETFLQTFARLGPSSFAGPAGSAEGNSAAAWRATVRGGPHFRLLDPERWLLHHADELAAATIPELAVPQVWYGQTLRLTAELRVRRLDPGRAILILIRPQSGSTPVMTLRVGHGCAGDELRRRRFVEFSLARPGAVTRPARVELEPLELHRPLSITATWDSVHKRLSLAVRVGQGEGGAAARELQAEARVEAMPAHGRCELVVQAGSAHAQGRELGDCTSRGLCEVELGEVAFLRPSRLSGHAVKAYVNNDYGELKPRATADRLDQLWAELLLARRDAKTDALRAQSLDRTALEAAANRRKSDDGEIRCEVPMALLAAEVLAGSDEARLRELAREAASTPRGLQSCAALWIWLDASGRERLAAALEVEARATSSLAGRLLRSPAAPSVLAQIMPVRPKDPSPTPDRASLVRMAVSLVRYGRYREAQRLFKSLGYGEVPEAAAGKALPPAFDAWRLAERALAPRRVR